MKILRLSLGQLLLIIALNGIRIHALHINIIKALILNLIIRKTQNLKKFSKLVQKMTSINFIRFQMRISMESFFFVDRLMKIIFLNYLKCQVILILIKSEKICISSVMKLFQSWIKKNNCILNFLKISINVLVII